MRSAMPSCWPTRSTRGSQVVNRCREALAAYQQRRDEQAAPGFESSSNLLDWSRHHWKRRSSSAALQHNQEQTDRFFGTFAGTVPMQAFFSPENLGQIMGGSLHVAAPEGT